MELRRLQQRKRAVKQNIDWNYLGKGYIRMIEKLKNNIWFIIKNGTSFVLTILTVIGTGFTLFSSELEVWDTKSRITVLLWGVMGGYLFYFLMTLIKRRVVAYEDENKKIFVQYGDFIELIKKHEKSKEKAVFVIPVNRCFDTVVDDVIIEKKTIHGQFVDFFVRNVCSLKELDEKIEEALTGYSGDDLLKDVKDKGKTKRYPVGTIAKIENVRGNIFYLLALAPLKKDGQKIVVDENIDLHDYFEYLQNMVDYYNKDGRNLPIYMPTIGCGLSRLYISIDNSIRQLIDIWRMNQHIIRDTVHIVVYKKNFWNVHILKYRKE